MGPCLPLSLSQWLLLHTATTAAAAAASVDLVTNICDWLPGLDYCNGTLLEPINTGFGAMMTPVNVCDAIRDAIAGGAAANFIANAHAICSCIPQNIQLIESEEYTSIYTYGEISLYIVSVIGTVNDVDTCIVNSGLLVETDRAQVIQTQLTSSSGWTVVTGAEIDVNMYSNLMTAVKFCYYNVGCGAGTVYDWFWEYYQASWDLVQGDLYRMLNNWLNIYDTINQTIADITSATNTLFTSYDVALSKVQTQKKAFCSKGACDGSTVKTWLKKGVDATLSSVNGRLNIPKSCKRATNALPAMVNSTNTAIDYSTWAFTADKYPYALTSFNYLGELFMSRDITQMSDILKGFKITTVLPGIAASLKTQVAPVAALAQELGNIQTTEFQLNEVLGMNWKSSANKKLFTTSPGRRLQSGLISMQSTLNSELKKPLDNVASALQKLEAALNKLPLTKHNLDLKYGAAPVARKNVNSFTAPCGEQRQQLVFGQVYEPYTHLYQCQYGPESNDLPPHYIPYIKWRFT